MERGERFAVAGYDLVAAALLASPRDAGGTDSEVVVLNNNWNYFLVATRGAGEPSATLEAEFVYGEHDDKEAYLKALQHMCMIARTR